MSELINYKQLCELLEVPVVNGGTQKVKQLKELEQFHVFNKVGRKYEYIRPKTPQEVEESRLYETYNTLMQTIFYSILHFTDGYELKITMAQMIRRMGFVNDNYYYGKYNQLEVCSIMDLEPLEVQRFFTNTETNFIAKIKKMLSDMEDKSLISYHRELTLGKKKDGYTVTRVADKEEEKEFLRIQQLLLEQFKHPNGESKMRTELDYDERYLLHNNLLYEIRCQMGYDYYSYEYDIILNKMGIEEHMNRNLVYLKHMLNDKVKTNLLERYNINLLDWFIDLGAEQLKIESKKDNSPT